jgi:hypothetical protein
MRSIRYCAVILALAAPSQAWAGDDLAQRRQADIQAILSNDPYSHVPAARANCAIGGAPAVVKMNREAGFTEVPDAADECVSALTAMGRIGQLGYMRDKRTTVTTPSIAFDNGFVTAYLKHEAIPAGLPAMVTLKPVAERCLAQNENDTDLCYSVGYAYGVRASNGEIVQAQ